MSEKIYKNVNGVNIEMQGEELAYFQKLRTDFANAPKHTALYMAMEDLRAKRNKLLQETDHYALSDQTLSDDMRTYRQSLRDITNGLTTVADVEAVVFPTKP